MDLQAYWEYATLYNLNARKQDNGDLALDIGLEVDIDQQDTNSLFKCALSGWDNIAEAKIGTRFENHVVELADLFNNLQLLNVAVHKFTLKPGDATGLKCKMTVTVEDADDQDLVTLSHLLNATVKLNINPESAVIREERQEEPGDDMLSGRDYYEGNDSYPEDAA